jgi:AraC-like DNA-binding protein
MTSAAHVPTLRFSTGRLPEAERIAAWRELYGREVLRLEIEPLRDHPFKGDLTVRMLPGLDVVSGVNSPFRVGRTRQLIADGNDNLIFQMATCAGAASQLGREVAVGANDAILLSNADVGSFTFPSTSTITALSLPRTAISALLRDNDAALVRPIPQGTKALRLLRRYLDVLEGGSALATPQLQALAVTHVYDLVAVTLGATRDAAETANRRGLRAARLQAIKADIGENLRQADLSIVEVAARHRITPRYVQSLFENEGITFTEFVLTERLACAHRMLRDSRLADRSITTVAFDVGFGDVSYFNRTFRLRYGATPSDVRASRSEPSSRATPTSQSKMGSD